MKMNAKKLTIIVLLILLVGIIVLLIFLGLNGKKRIYPENEFEMYEQLADCCIDYTSEVIVESDFSPRVFSYDALMISMKQRDEYLAYNLLSYSYTYDIVNSRYVTTFKFHYVSSKLENFLADWRMRDLCNYMNGLTDYEKVKAVHDYVIKLSRYSYLGSGKGAFWALYAREPVCMGYALTFYRMMQFCGISATYETGADHAWNRVCLDGYWYNIDLTWDDSGGDGISYDYFLKCDEDWKGHAHGGATAPNSLEPTGRTADENYNLFPNYRLITIIVILVIIAAIITLRILLKRKKEHKRYSAAEAEVARQIEINRQMFDTYKGDFNSDQTNQGP